MGPVLLAALRQPRVLVHLSSSPACSVSCMRLASSAPCSCGPTTSGPALLMRVKNVWLRGCIRRPIGGPPGPTVAPYAAQRRFARSWPVHSGEQGEGRVPTPLHPQYIAHRGACGKTRVVPYNHRHRPEPTEVGGANACVGV